VATPDGHRAPIADQLLRVRSVDTQTPCGGGASGSAGQTVIGRRWRHDDVVAGNSPVTSATTTVLPVVPFDSDDDDSGDLDSDDDSKYWRSITITDTASVQVNLDQPLTVFFHWFWKNRWN